MQATAKSSDTQTDVNTAGQAVDPGYVGKHRPGRMSLTRQRVRVSQLASRKTAQAD